MKGIIQKLLKKLTYKVLEKQKPNIITITGSIGKTSTKEGIYFAIKGLGGVRRSLKNYNNELGVPFTVALWSGKTPGKNPIRWLLVFCRLVYFSIFKNQNYPKWLVLETGSDKPGDLKYLMEMIPAGLLKCAVLTAVFGVHLEFFKTIEAVYQEKTTPFNYVVQSGLILINNDNCDIEKIKKDFGDKAKIVSYGFEKPADITAFDFSAGDKGLNFKIKTSKETFEFLLKQAISAYQCYPILAGMGAALNFGVEIEKAFKSLSQKEPIPGRMRLIAGINNSLIIDDTYNSSPESCKRALEALSTIPGAKRKIAVLGDMLELGETSEELHKTIGQVVAQLKIDYLITYGQMAKFMALEAEKSKIAVLETMSFFEIDKLSEFLNALIKQGDIALVKGSQGMRLEKIVKNIMAQPEKAKDLLVRQGREWNP